MTTQEAHGLKRTCSLAGAGAVLATVGAFAAVPALFATGLLVCWGSTFVTLIAYMDTLP